MLLKYLSALSVGIYSINADTINNNGVVGAPVAANFDRPTNENKQYSDMLTDASGNLVTELDQDDEHWRLVVYKTPENIDNDCECDPNSCPYWTYSNGGGYEDLSTCGDRDDAIAEAKSVYTALQHEAAQDDIGQILIQIEALLVQRDGRNSGIANACHEEGNIGNSDDRVNNPRSFCWSDNKNTLEELKNSQVSFPLTQNQGGLDVTSECKCQCGYDNRIESCNVDPETSNLKRFKNLKAMVMSMQPPEVMAFGRYCYYGCWCLPNGQHNLAAGYGQPVDPIDEVCKEFSLCYKCLDMDFAGTCDPEKRSYRWGKIRDEDNNVVDVECKDDVTKGVVHRCKRYTCECDKVLAVGLGQTHMYHNDSHHARWGGFDREASCETDCVGCKPQDDCCGAYGSASTEFTHLTVTRRPYASTSTTAGCCQDVFYYNLLAQECCVDGSTVTVTDAGTCPGSTIDPDQIDDFNDNYPGYTRK